MRVLSYLLVFLRIVLPVFRQFTAAMIVALLQGVCAVLAVAGPDVHSWASSSCFNGEQVNACLQATAAVMPNLPMKPAFQSRT
ncbi:unnamed protein product [Caretta caretta]